MLHPARSQASLSTRTSSATAVFPEAVGSYRYLKGLPHGLKVDCRVRVFPLAVDDLCKNFPEKGERRAEWVTCAEAASRVQEPGLKTLLLAFERKILTEAATGA